MTDELNQLKNLEQALYRKTSFLNPYRNPHQLIKHSPLKGVPSSKFSAITSAYHKFVKQSPDGGHAA